MFERDANLLALLSLVGGIAILTCVLAIHTHSVPRTETVTTTLATYEQLGRYSYSVETSPSPLNLSDVIGPVYPESTMDGGELPPIFTRLAKKIHVLFVYKLSSASDVSGTVSAEMTIQAGESWSQRVPLAEPIAFTGAVGGVEATIDIVQISSLLSRIREQTGLESERVELKIAPIVEVDGVAGGQQFHERFLHPLMFIYTPDLIIPDRELAYTEPDEITVTSERTKELQLPGARMPVATARTLLTPAAIGAVTLTVLIAITWFYSSARSDDTLLGPELRSSIVPITHVETPAGYRVTVESLLDLLNMAKDKRKSLLVREFEAGQVYLVADGMLMFQHVVGAVPADWMNSPQSSREVQASLAPPAGRDATSGTGDTHGEQMYSKGKTESALTADANRLEPASEIDAFSSPIAKEIQDLDRDPPRGAHIIELVEPPASVMAREDVPRGSTSRSWQGPQSANQIVTGYAKKWFRDFFGLTQNPNGKGRH